MDIQIPIPPTPEQNSTFEAEHTYSPPMAALEPPVSPGVVARRIINHPKLNRCLSDVGGSSKTVPQVQVKNLQCRVENMKREVIQTAEMGQQLLQEISKLKEEKEAILEAKNTEVENLQTIVEDMEREREVLQCRLVKLQCGQNSLRSDFICLEEAVENWKTAVRQSEAEREVLRNRLLMSTATQKTLRAGITVIREKVEEEMKQKQARLEMECMTLREELFKLMEEHDHCRRRSMYTVNSLHHELAAEPSESMICEDDNFAVSIGSKSSQLKPVSARSPCLSEVSLDLKFERTRMLAQNTLLKPVNLSHRVMQGYVVPRVRGIVEPPMAFSRKAIQAYVVPRVRSMVDVLVAFSRKGVQKCVISPVKATQARASHALEHYVQDSCWSSMRLPLEKTHAEDLFE